MVWFFSLLGALLGMFLEAGFWLGAILGALVGWNLRLNGQVARLEQRVRQDPSLPPPVAPDSASAPAAAAPRARAAAPSPPVSGGRVVVPECPPPPLRSSPARDPMARSVAAWIRVARAWLTQGNLPAKTGVVVFLLGAGALLNYAVDEGYLVLSIQVRLVVLSALSLAAMAWGWGSRNERPRLAVALQGGGYGLLMLVVFASQARYGLLPPAVGLSMVAALVGWTTLAALRQGSQGLAALGLAGGYLAPVMVAAPGASPATLFGIYALLNAAVFTIAGFRRWRWLDLMGFAFTFVIGLSWASRYYSPEWFGVAEFFLALFFVSYTLVPLLHAASARPPSRKIDTALLFGAPLLAFPLQASLLRGDALGLAVSALSASGLYLGLFLWSRRQPRLEGFEGPTLGLAIAAATLAIPLSLDAPWTTVAWALEGLVLGWVGLARGRMLPRLAGLVLLILAFLAWVGAQWKGAGPALVNGPALALATWCLALFLSGWRHHGAGKKVGAWTLAGVALFAWVFLLGLPELHALVQGGTWDPWDGGLATAMGAWMALLALLLAIARSPLAWPALDRFHFMAVVGVALALAGDLLARPVAHPFEPAMAAWWLSLAMVFASLLMSRAPLSACVRRSSVVAWGTLSLVLAAGCARGLRDVGAGQDWAWMASLLPWGALLAIHEFHPGWLDVPRDIDPKAPARRWRRPVAAMAAMALVALFFQGVSLPGSSPGVPYLPVFNPVDLGLIAMLLAAPYWLDRPGRAPLAWRCWGAAAWVALTLSVARAAHHFLSLPWSLDIALDARLQAAWSVCWGVAGVVLWVIGSRRARRSVWAAGALLMGLVVAKLVLVDWHNLGTLPGIAAFVGVGVLLVAIGRLAPSPPPRAG